MTLNEWMELRARCEMAIARAVADGMHMGAVWCPACGAWLHFHRTAQMGLTYRCESAACRVNRLPTALAAVACEPLAN